MKQTLLLLMTVFFSSILLAQVTQLSSNKSLRPLFNFSDNLGVLYSEADTTYWVSDGTVAGTKQLSSTIHYTASGGGLINGKYVFAAYTNAGGRELFISDGTPAGTTLVKDIYPGAIGSDPRNFVSLNGDVYFTCTTAANGRELWKTNGTAGGTVLVKDVVTGAAGMNHVDSIKLFSTGDYLLFSATSPAKGHELWKSDGTAAGTVLLKDINPAANASSDPSAFLAYTNMVLFQANNGTNGIELWKTDGTPAGTTMLKDINLGPLNSVTSITFHLFNNKAYFLADNTTNGQELWSTNGTTAGTAMVADINPGPIGCYAQLFFSVNMGSKFVFSALSATSGFELWQTDGTSAGTTLLKDIQPGTGSSNAFILPALVYDNATGTFSAPLFQGNKVFLMASTTASGNELWITDGTSAGTKLVKDINPGSASGMTSLSWAYTTTAIYFAADNGTNGNELWKSDGITANTSMVADINPGAPSGDIVFGFIANNKLVFKATNGDNSDAKDVYRLDANVQALPVTLSSFTVYQKESDAVLSWSTLSEVNTKDFTIQRSINGIEFTNIGTVEAAGNSGDKRNYSFSDAGVIKTVKNNVYYRLLLTDKDGKTGYSGIISLKIKGAEGTLMIVSNPVKAELNVRYNGLSKTNLYIRDMTGKAIPGTHPVSGTGSISIPVDRLMPGMYMLVSQGENGRSVTNFIKD